MKSLSLAFLTSIILSACALAPPGKAISLIGTIVATGTTVDPGWVVALSGHDNGTGHGCPISEHLILTAAHMTTEFYPTEGFLSFPLRWSDSSGSVGIVEHVWTDPASDLALMHSDAPFTVWYPVARTGPKVGDAVYVVGYDFSAKRFKLPRLVATKVVSESAGRLYYEKDGAPGSSGSCTLNDQMEVVAVNNTMEGSPFDGTLQLGGSVAVYDGWLPAEMAKFIRGEK